MAALTQERPEYTMFHAVNRMVMETRRNDALDVQHGRHTQDNNIHITTGTLLEALTRKHPNRIYFSPDGKICRVLFFGEKNMPYQVRIENIEFQPETRISREEVFSTSSFKYLEQEVSFWRSRFGMSRDLTLNPEQVLASLTRQGDILHIGESSRGAVFSRYELTILGLRVVDMGVGTDFRLDTNETFTRLPLPLGNMLKYADPFPKQSLK